MNNQPAKGFSLIELLVAMTILGALLAIAIPRFNQYRDQQKVNITINDLRTLDNKIQSYKASNEAYPSALTDLPATGISNDPWGNPYQYLKIEGADAKSKGNMRKDKNLVPINSDFDLYSNGADGKTSAPLTASVSQDDVVRGNDGRYFGLGANY